MQLAESDSIVVARTAVEHRVVGAARQHRALDLGVACLGRRTGRGDQVGDVNLATGIREQDRNVAETFHMPDPHRGAAVGDGPHVAFTAKDRLGHLGFRRRRGVATELVDLRGEPRHLEVARHLARARKKRAATRVLSIRVARRALLARALVVRAASRNEPGLRQPRPCEERSRAHALVGGLSGGEV